MAGSSWKVAYADFMTAMMAFFLVMWLLNMAPQETLQGMSLFFREGAQAVTNTTSPYQVENLPTIKYVEKLDTREMSIADLKQAHYAIAQSMKAQFTQDALPQAVSGITSSSTGVLLQITGDLLFKPGTTEFTPEGQKILAEVLAVMSKYNVYLVVRGHADSSESGAPYPSRWELSAARANAAVSYLVAHGAPPGRVRSVAYADTNPLVPSNVPGAAARNARVEFNFHRPEVMSTIAGY